MIAAGVAETGITKDLSKTLQETTGISPAVADRMANVVVEPIKAATSAAATGGNAEQAALNAIAGQGLSAAGDVIANAAKAIAKDVEIKQAELPAAYTEGRMYAGADTGTMTDVPVTGVVRLTDEGAGGEAEAIASEKERYFGQGFNEISSENVDSMIAGFTALSDVGGINKAWQNEDGTYTIRVSENEVYTFSPDFKFIRKEDPSLAIFAFGTPDPTTINQPLLGTGATVTKPFDPLGFSLISFDSPMKKQEYLNIVLDNIERAKSVNDIQRVDNLNELLNKSKDLPIVSFDEPTITETQKQPSNVVAGGGDVGAEAADAAAGAAAEQVAPTAPEPTAPEPTAPEPTAPEPTAPVTVTQEPITPVDVIQAPPTLEPSVEQAILQQILNEPTTTTNVLTQDSAPEINVTIEPVEPIDGTIDSGVSQQQEPTSVTVTDGQAEAESAYGTGGYESVSEPITSEDIYNNIYSELYGEPTGVSEESVAGTAEEGESLASAGLAEEGYETARETGDVDAGEADVDAGEADAGTGAGEVEGKGGTEDAITRQLMNVLFPRGQSFQYTGTSGGGAGTESGAYLGRGMAEGTTGEPILGVKGKQKRKVWNIESLRDALGV